MLKEIVDPHGARYELRKIPVGDPTLSAMEIWGAEYQENCAFLVAPEVPHTPPTQLTNPNHLIQTKPPPVQSNPTQITPPNSNPTQPKPPNPPNPTPAQLTLTHFFTITYHYHLPPPCPEPRDGAGSGQARALPRDPRGRGNGRRAGGARGLGCGCQRQPPHPLRPPPVARARQDAAEGQCTASVTTRRTFTTHIHYHRTMSYQHTPSTHPTRPYLTYTTYPTLPCLSIYVTHASGVSLHHAPPGAHSTRAATHRHHRRHLLPWGWWQW